MTFNEIENLLDTRLAQLPSSPPVAWPNVPYTPTTGVTYLRVSRLPAESESVSLDYIEMQNGIYQIDVVAPLGNGTGAANTMAESIAAHFSAQRHLGTDTDYVAIRNISRNGGLRDESWWVVSVSITYNAHIAR